MSPTMRRASGRSTRSSTRRSSSRMATRVSRGLPLINISRFKACALDPGRPAARRDPIVVPASTHSEPMDGGGVDPIGWTTRSWRTEGAQRGEQSGSPMHSLNLSGLATYVNSPEISSYAACTQRLSVCGGTPDRHVARWGRRSGARPNDPISTGAPQRGGGRLPRHASAGPVPLARGARRAGNARLDRGGEPGHGIVPGPDPAAGDPPPAAHATVELSQIRRAIPQGGAVLLLQERRLSEPNAALQAGAAPGRRPDRPRRERAVPRRDPRPLHPGGGRGRAAARPPHLRERGGLGAGCPARHRDGAPP